MTFDKRAIRPSKISKLVLKLDTEHTKYNFEYDNDEYVQNSFETSHYGGILVEICYIC